MNHSGDTSVELVKCERRDAGVKGFQSRLDSLSATHGGNCFYVF